jgi:hypothetical protein
MAISITNSALSFAVGQDFVFQPSSDIAVTRWAINSQDFLPAGVFFSPLSGTIQGNCQVAGIYKFRLQAISASSTSEVEIVMGFFGIAEESYEKKVVIDTATLVPTFLDGNTSATSGYDTFAKYGDDLIWSISFAKSGSVISPRVASISFAVRKDDESEVLLESDYTSYRYSLVLEGGLYYPRNYVQITLASEGLAGAVSDNLSATGTFCDILGEFQIDFASPIGASGSAINRVTTKSFKMRIARDIANSVL